MKTEKPSDFRKFIEPVCRSHDTRVVFDAFVKLSACALSAQTREAEYMEEVKRWQKPELTAFSQALGALVVEMESKPFTDVLGGYYMEFALSTKGQQWRGEFHTPKTICDLMARMTVGDGAELPKDRPITVCEPACGAGAMILSLAEAMPEEARRRLRVTAIDVCRTACDMCFINTTLWHIPTRVIHGNTLTMEMWAGWSNFALMMSPTEVVTPDGQTKKLLPPPQGEPPRFRELEQIKAAVGQQQLQLV